MNELQREIEKYNAERAKARKAHGVGKTDGEKIQEQLNHQFYKDAEGFREMIKLETMTKASMKYDEPFNPASWTNESLAKHAMAENYDQTNYIYGMFERMNEQAKDVEEQHKDILRLEKELEFANNEATFWRLRAEQENELYVDLHFRYRIMTAPDGKKRAVQKEYIDHLDMVKAKKEQKQ